MARGRALRFDRSAVSATVGTVLMVAITVLLAGVVYILVSGVLNPVAPAPAAVSFDSPGWVGANYTATVIGVTGASGIPVDSLTYIVRDPDRIAYLVGPANTPDETNGITTTVYYIDHDSDNRITGGDSVRIEVSPAAAYQAFDGGVFEVHYQDQTLALSPM